MSDLGETLGSILSQQQSDNQALTHEGGSVPKLIVPVEEIEIEECTKLEQKSIAGNVLIYVTITVLR